MAKKKDDSNGDKQIRQKIHAEDLEEYEKLKASGYDAPTAAAILHLRRQGIYKGDPGEKTPKSPGEILNPGSSPTENEAPPKTADEVSARTTGKIADIGVRLLEKKVEEWSEKEKAEAMRLLERQKVLDEQKARPRREIDPEELKRKAVEEARKEVMAVKKSEGLSPEEVDRRVKEAEERAAERVKRELKEEKNRQRDSARIKQIEGQLSMLASPEAQLEHSIGLVERMKHHDVFRPKEKLLDGEAIGAIADVVQDGFDKWSNLQGKKMGYEQTVGKYREVLNFFRELQSMGILEKVGLSDPNPNKVAQMQAQQQAANRPQVPPFVAPPPEEGESQEAYFARVMKAKQAYDMQIQASMMYNNPYMQQNPYGAPGMMPQQQQQVPLNPENEEMKNGLRNIIGDLVNEALGEAMVDISGKGAPQKEPDEEKEDDSNGMGSFFDDDEDEDVSVSADDLLKQMKQQKPEEVSKLQYKRQMWDMAKYLNLDVKFTMSGEELQRKIEEHCYKEGLDVEQDLPWEKVIHNSGGE